MNNKIKILELDIDSDSLVKRSSEARKSLEEIKKESKDLKKVLDEQSAYQFLDSKPVCVSAHDHRPAYATDGDYFSKPNPEDITEAAYKLMNEFNPQQFPELY